MLKPDYIKEKIQTIIQLPALPTVALEIAELVDNPRTSAAKLGKVISTDQALTAKVLKIANSAFYGFPKKISTVDFAIIILGFDTLKDIVVSLSLVSALQKKSDAFLDAQKFWDHAISTGVIGRKLARDMGYRVSGEVFVAGLLHDMGISILHQYFANEFKSVVGLTKTMGATYLEAEQQVLGVTHAEVGGWLAERWNFPNHLIEAITLHHTPEKAKQNPGLVAFVHCADVLTSRTNTDSTEFDTGIDFDPAALATLGLDDAYVLEDYLSKSNANIFGDVHQSSGKLSVRH